MIGQSAGRVAAYAPLAQRAVGIQVCRAERRPALGSSRMSTSSIPTMRESVGADATIGPQRRPSAQRLTWTRRAGPAICRAVVSDLNRRPQRRSHRLVRPRRFVVPGLRLLGAARRRGLAQRRTRRARPTVPTAACSRVCREGWRATERSAVGTRRPSRWRLLERQIRSTLASYCSTELRGRQLRSSLGSSRVGNAEK